ncbi:hypothetical protein EV401DRAFT_1886397 [Pisolithus croceorrhizus]|nr:hypothetical protein EV401DRAFT_1886397 [Pisolithus croceorrhizus]
MSEHCIPGTLTDNLAEHRDVPLAGSSISPSASLSRASSREDQIQAHPFKNVYGKVNTSSIPVTNFHKSEAASYNKHEYVGTIVFCGTSGPTYRAGSATGLRTIGAGSNFCVEQLR